MLTQEIPRHRHRTRRPGKGVRWERVAAVFIVPILLVSTISGGALYARPLPGISSQPAKLTQPTAAASVDMPWPAYGQSAVGLAGGGILASSTGTNKQTPLPTASVAKVMTALAVLDKKPLSPGQAGPTITITKNDMAIYNYYFSVGGSLAAMQEGEKISQYDALQALMLPSANNFADTLAIWAFGSIDDYTAYANKMADSFGMKNSHFADASGFSPQTVSTADDLVRLADRALRNPVLAEISAKREATIPVAGVIHNVNGLLGKNGINGIKTGNTDQAGGVFLVSAERQLPDGKTGTVIACVMGGPDLVTAMLATLPLLDATATNIVNQTVVKKGEVFGTYTAPWDSGQSAKAVASKDITLLTWKDAPIKVTAALKSLDGPQIANADAGKATVTASSQSVDVPLVLDHDLTPPSWWWRVTRS